MERGKSGGAAARPGCRVCFLFGYFLFAQAGKEKVTRREGEKRSFGVKWGLSPMTVQTATLGKD